ncbi:MAG: TraB/GumN family protein [Betaproteobacteria bacterium]|nr:MAG: TraB/GumN family protein [Betaproteobacteria bacterium]
MLVAAYAATAVAVGPAPEARQDVPRRGLLYEIRTGASTVYLFGTLHVGKPELYPLSRQTNLALAASERLYLEVSLTDATSGYQFPQELALKMKPWMLGQTLLLLEAKRRGYDPELANEFYLMDYARAAHKEILGLETLSEQFAIFDRMSQAQQQAFLEQTLSELEDSRFEARLKALVDAWANADALALEDELQYEKTQDSVFASILLPRLIDERNRVMADRIADIVRSGPKSFVAVGALHLVGKDGIVERLRRRGFTVRQL